MSFRTHMPADVWAEYCWLKRRLEYLESRYSHFYKFKSAEIEQAYADVSQALVLGIEQHECSR